MIKNPFRNKFADHQVTKVYGCVSRRDSDFVMLAGENAGKLTLSKMSRNTSLEKLRLNGRIKNIVPNYLARTARLEELKYSGELDVVKIGADYIKYIKQQKVNLLEKRAAFTIDPSGTVAGTTARLKDVTDAVLSVDGFRASLDGRCPVSVETRGRAALRFYLKKTNIESAEEIAVCLSVVDQHGYSIVFWTSQKGLCWETEQPFSAEDTEDNWTAVADELKRLLGPASLQTLKLAMVNRIAVVASNECRQYLHKELAGDEIKFEDVFVAEGSDYLLTEGSQAIGENETEAIIAIGLFLSDARVPAIDLNLDLEQDIRVKEEHRVLRVQKQTAAANRNLTLLLVAPLVIALVCGLIFYLSLWKQETNIAERQKNADAEQSKLAAVTQELQQIKTSSDQVQAIVNQIGTLRKRQPANFLLLMALNRKWPSAGAPWQVDEISSKPDGTVTVKGKTTSDESLTEFAKNLDFSEDFDTVKVSKGEGSIGAPVYAGFSNQPGTGVIKFAVEARYLPLVAPAATPVPAAVAPPPTGAGTPPNVPPASPLPPQVAGSNQPKQPNS